MTIRNKVLETIAPLIQEWQNQSLHSQNGRRPLRPDEEALLKQLEVAFAYLEAAKQALTLDMLDPGIDPKGYKPAVDDVRPDSFLQDGRFQGGSDRYFFDLRLDESVSGVISGDIFTSDPLERTYLASFRSTPGQRVRLLEENWSIVAQDDYKSLTTGILNLSPQPGGRTLQLVGQLSLDGPIQGLPSDTPINFVAVRVSDKLRTLGLEMEVEVGVDPPTLFEFNGRPVTIRSCFEEAGFDIIEVGQIDRVPRPANPKGWGNTETLVLSDDLNRAMDEYAQASLSRRAWELHYLVLSQSTRTGLNGIMFDNSTEFPRQGVAVFAQTIQSNYGDLAQRKLIQTLVHELGHGLNLVHRFERQVGRADSISFMNYDWRYKNLNRPEEFWRNFCFTFDSDELEFLRHAPLAAVSPGGDRFHSVSYWTEAGNGYASYAMYGEHQLRGYQLTLKPPLGGSVFAFGQPIFLEIELKNISGRALLLPSNFLDPKGDLLQIMIRRVTGVGPAVSGPGELFIPIIQRCYDLIADEVIRFEPGDSMNNNLNLTYGSGGFAFAEPGEYEIIAVFGIIIGTAPDTLELVCYSNPLRIRVATPHSIEEERDALILLRDDVGLYFALGGADNLNEAKEALQEVQERRQGKSRNIKDPIVANIIRCRGIDAGRSYLRLRDDGKFQSKDGDRAQAADLLEKLDKQAMHAFDAHTAESTAQLAEKHREAAKA